MNENNNVSTLAPPQSPRAYDTIKEGIRPEDYIPDMAAAKIAEKLIDGLGTPTIISKEFAVRQGIFKALNHRPGNETGYDSSIRIALYDHVAAQSVNIDGQYFRYIWAWLMKPKFVMQGSAYTTQFAEDKPSLLTRLLHPQKKTAAQSQPVGDQNAR